MNLRGERFCNEQVYGATLGHAMVEEHGGRAFLVLDARLRRQAIRECLFGGLWAFQALPALALMIFGAKKGRSVEDLAARLKVDPATLRASVETYNTAARAGGGDPLGKSPDMCQALETGPYYALDLSIGTPLLPLATITMGGLRVNEGDGRVLGTTGQAIAGLYAAGRTAVGLPWSRLHEWPVAGRLCLLGPPRGCVGGRCNQGVSVMDQRLQGKLALVTGGASGVGKETALRLAHEGARVVITDLNEDGGHAVAAGDLGEGALFLKHDVSSEADWAKVMATVHELSGALDVLVNNAGILDSGNIESLSLEHWQKLLRVNADSVFLGTRAGVAAMKGARRSHRQHRLDLELAADRWLRRLRGVEGRGGCGDACRGAPLPRAAARACELGASRRHLDADDGGQPARRAPPGSSPSTCCTMSNAIPRGAPACRVRWPRWWSSSPATTPGPSMAPRCAWTTACWGWVCGHTLRRAGARCARWSRRRTTPSR